MAGTDLAEIGFAEGFQRVIAPGGGWPATTRFRLSQAPVAADVLNPAIGELYRGSQFSLGDLNECAGAGYAALDVVTPAPVGGVITFPAALQWQVPSPGAWSSACWTLVATDANLALLYAWSLVSSPLTALSPAQTNTIQVVDPTYFLIGAQVRLGVGASFETMVVQGVAGNVVTFTQNTSFAHAAGSLATASQDMSIAGKKVLIAGNRSVFLQNVGSV